MLTERDDGVCLFPCLNRGYLFIYSDLHLPEAGEAHTIRASPFLRVCLHSNFYLTGPPFPQATEYEARIVFPRVEGSMLYSDSNPCFVVSLKWHLIPSRCWVIFFIPNENKGMHLRSAEGKTGFDEVFLVPSSASSPSFSSHSLRGTWQGGPLRSTVLSFFDKRLGLLVASVIHSGPPPCSLCLLGSTSKTAQLHFPSGSFPDPPPWSLTHLFLIWSPLRSQATGSFPPTMTHMTHHG